MFQITSEEYFTYSDAAICTEPRSPQINFPEHSHDFHELVIVTKGSGLHVINDLPVNLTQNYICYISPKDRHLYDQVEDLHLTNILYKKNRLSYLPLLKNILPQEDSGSKSWYIATETMKRVQWVIKHIEQESKLNTVESRVMTEALFQQLVVELSRGRLSAQSNDAMDNTILKVIDWLQNHYQEDLCIGEISEQFHISSRTLSRRIKQFTNLTFNNYIHRIRINNAMNLLNYTDQSITDIAFQVGYKDSNYFCTKFKRFTNKTPSEFR